jgi:hypothetical protein
MQNNSTDGAVPGRTTMSTRGPSRKLLARKAAARSADEHGGDALEDVFPAGEDAGVDVAGTGGEQLAAGQPDQAGEAPADDAAAESTTAPAEYIEPTAAAPADASPLPQAEPESGSSDAAPAVPAPAPASAPAWSETDEAALNVMLARRKAAKYQRRGKDVSGQLIRVGDVAPNPGTVVAVIVGLVAQAGGAVGRGELVELMAGATFPHPKAQPQDKGWCTGYVAGAVRTGALAVGAADQAGVMSHVEPAEDRAKAHAEADSERAAA